MVNAMASWIFQGNPSHYQVDRRLKETREVLWVIRQKEFLSGISLGDEVFIWRAEGCSPGTSGIVAKGVIISLPKEMRDDKPEYWVEQPKKELEPRLWIKIEDARLSAAEGMLRKSDLIDKPVVGNMKILYMWRQTNYKITPDCARRLRYLWAIGAGIELSEASTRYTEKKESG